MCQHAAVVRQAQREAQVALRERDQVERAVLGAARQRKRRARAKALVAAGRIVGRPLGPQAARLAFGGLAHKPWRVAEAETALVQTGSADAASDRVLEGARGQGSNDFKIPLTRRTLRATVAEALRA